MENEDPDNFQRVQLKVPQVYGNNTMEYWAWPKGIFSGDGYGFQCTPQKGEMVWVEFEFGDPKKPIYHYGHFGNSPTGQSEKPEALKDIGNFWFKTPKGHLIEFDDTNQEIRITDLKGNTLKLKGGIIALNGEAEPAVLGNKNEDVLKDIYAVLKDINTKLVQIGTADATIASNLGLSYAATLAQLVSNVTTLAGIQTNISKTKSDKVKLS